MSLHENFKAHLDGKKVPYDYQEIQGGNHLFRMRYRITDDRSVVVEVIIQHSDDDYADVQMIYRQLHFLQDRNKEADALRLINELNESKTGYYYLFLAGDGEIFLRSLMRSGSDPEPLYQTIVIGSAIAKNIIPELAEKLG